MRLDCCYVVGGFHDGTDPCGLSSTVHRFGGTQATVSITVIIRFVTYMGRGSLMEKGTQWLSKHTVEWMVVDGTLWQRYRMAFACQPPSPVVHHRRRVSAGWRAALCADSNACLEFNC